MNIASDLQPVLGASSSLAVTMSILSGILVATPLMLTNLALTASKCDRSVAFTINIVVLCIALFVAVALMIFDLPAHLGETVAHRLPLILFLQTVILFFKRKNSIVPERQ